MKRPSAISLIGIALIAIVSAVQAGPPDEPIVSVRWRHPYAICAGVCPNFDLRLGRDGSITTTDLFSGETRQFQVDSNKLRRFQALLGTVRPKGDKAADGVCEQSKQQDGSIDPLSDARLDDIELRWMDARGADRLTACAWNEEIGIAVQRALRALGVDATGRKEEAGTE